MLRLHAKIKEERVCFKCPFKESCTVAKQPYQGTMDQTPKHLLTFWTALDKVNRPDDIYFRQWTSAYKLGDSFIAALEDLAEGGKEVEEYDRLRVETAIKHE
jgi:hypothetical protein